MQTFNKLLTFLKVQLIFFAEVSILIGYKLRKKEAVLSDFRQSFFCAWIYIYTVLLFNLFL